MVAQTLKLWAVVPAAGVGSRIGAAQAKQYLFIHEQTILEHTLRCLLKERRIEQIVVALNKEDTSWLELPISHHPKLESVQGGASRAISVLNGLQKLLETADEDDWVLVHDAARPCLTQHALAKLVDSLMGGNHGGILALPARDTIKVSNSIEDQIPRVKETLERETIWHAQTPQMFPLGKLYKALEKAIETGLQITDEASAMEAAGEVVLLIEGESANIKVTTPEDLGLAQSFLQKTVQ